MRIAYIPSDMDAPGSYRCLFPGRQLAAHGHTVQLPPYKLVADVGGRRRFQFNIELEPPTPSADLWVLQQRMERMWSTEGGVNALRTHGIASVAEVDDNYLELPEWNPAFRGTHPYKRDDGMIINRAERRRIGRAMKMRVPSNPTNRTHMFEVFELVDAMTVSTPYLKQVYSAYNKNIHVVRNYVDWDIFGPVTPQCEVDRGGRVRIGYLGVFRYRQGDLAVIRKLIRPFMDQHPNVDFVANSQEVLDFLDIEPGRGINIGEYDFYPRDEDAPYPVGEMTTQLDIGLVPLVSGGMNEGKSHLKGMEYNAAGIPFIASNTESYRYWTDEGQNGYRAFRDDDWLEMLDHLVVNDDRRRQMGAYGRKKAERHSIQNNWQEWEQVYESVLGDKFTVLARGAVKRGAVQKVSELGDLLREVGKRKPAKLVVEIGSARGGTFWALAQLADDHAKMVSIDIPAGSPIDVHPLTKKDVYIGRDREKFKDYIKETQSLVLIDENSQRVSTVEKLVDSIGTQKIDILFIDGDHRFEGVKRDYMLYAPLVREGGLIVFHDVIRQNDPRSGVHLLWNDLRHKMDRQGTWHRTYLGQETYGLGHWAGIGAMEQGDKVVRV